MRDRVPTYPGRVTLTPVAGQTNTYDMVRADAPVEAGTPLNKANLMPDTLATTLGLNPATATVADGIAAAHNEVPVGDVRASIRADFKEHISAGKYLPCDGRVLDLRDYPDLAAVTTPVIGRLWLQNTPFGSTSANSMVVTDTGRIIVVRGSTTFYYSDDNGAIWSTGTTLGTASWIVKLPNNRLITYYSRSDDNGATWTKHSSSLGDLLTISPSALIASETSSASTNIRRSTDNGTTWTSVNVGASKEWRSGCVTSSGRIILGTSEAFSTTARYSDDGGVTWAAFTSNAPSDLTALDFVTTPSGTIIASMQSTVDANNGLWQSTNNGTSWTQVFSVSIYLSVFQRIQLFGDYLYAKSNSTIHVFLIDGVVTSVASATMENVSSRKNAFTEFPDGYVAVATTSGIQKTTPSVTLPSITGFSTKVAK